MEQQQKAPFKVFDNVYYVGLQTVCAYLVTTSNGLVLIDAGYAETVDWILDGVRKAGFDPMNIKYILVTHSHLDHAGGAGRMKQLIPGVRVGLSAEDWKVIEDQQSDAQQQRNFPVPLRRDLVLKDGESLAVGDTMFKFYFSPGHTPGATSIEYQVRDGSRSYRALSPGGLGMQFGPPWTPAFKKGMERLKQLGPWEVVLSNHPWLMPKDLAAIEKELPSRGQGPHPGVVGPARINAWFDSVLKVVNEKLASEQGGGQPASGL